MPSTSVKLNTQILQTLYRLATRITINIRIKVLRVVCPRITLTAMFDRSSTPLNETIGQCNSAMRRLCMLNDLPNII